MWSFPYEWRGQGQLQGQPVWLLDQKMWGQGGGLWDESECVGDGVGEVGGVGEKLYQELMG